MSISPQYPTSCRDARDPAEKYLGINTPILSSSPSHLFCHTTPIKYSGVYFISPRPKAFQNAMRCLLLAPLFPAQQIRKGTSKSYFTRYMSPKDVFMNISTAAKFNTPCNHKFVKGLLVRISFASSFVESTNLLPSFLLLLFFITVLIHC